MRNNSKTPAVWTHQIRNAEALGFRGVRIHHPVGTQVVFHQEFTGELGHSFGRGAASAWQWSSVMFALWAYAGDQGHDVGDWPNWLGVEDGNYLQN